MEGQGILNFMRESEKIAFLGETIEEVDVDDDEDTD
jgi:hypothetical protein